MIEFWYKYPRVCPFRICIYCLVCFILIWIYQKKENLQLNTYINYQGPLTIVSQFVYNRIYPSFNFDLAICKAGFDLITILLWYNILRGSTKISLTHLEVDVPLFFQTELTYVWLYNTSCDCFFMLVLK